MKRLIQWIKDRLGITALELEVKHMELTLDRHRLYVTNSMAELKEYTRVDADIGFRGNNTIVLTGVYRRKGYVKFYDMGDGEFESLVEQFIHMRKYSLVRHIDKPPSFHGTFDL